MVDFRREHPSFLLSDKKEVDPTPLHLRLLRTMVVYLPLLLRKSHASGVCSNDRACCTSNYVTLPIESHCAVVQQLPLRGSHNDGFGFSLHSV